jgi:hypothetical protein
MAFLILGTATLDRPGDLEPIAGYAISFFVDATPGSVKSNFQVSSVVGNLSYPSVESEIITPTVKTSQIIPLVLANFVVPTVQSEVEVLS